MVTHTRIHGSAVGRQLRETLPVNAQQLDAAGHTQAVTGLHPAQATSDLLCQIAPGNRIAFIDFGMVGRLTEERRDQLIRLLLGLVKQEPRRVAEVMLDWTGDSAMDEDSLLLEIQTFVQQYHGVALKQLRLGAMLSDLVAILRQHQLALPPDLSLLIKAFISLEGMGRELDPDFDMAGEAMPLLEQALRARYAPTASSSAAGAGSARRCRWWPVFPRISPGCCAPCGAGGWKSTSMSRT